MLKRQTAFLLTMTTNDKEDQPKTKNIFRQVPLRYLGYANEVGEAFRYQFPRLVLPSYAVAFGYCIADAATTGYETYNTSSNTGTKKQAGEERSRETKAAIATFDTLLWQSLASVMIPGATINVIVKASRYVLGRPPIPTVLAGWGPTAIGLGSIPLIIHPIDEFVDYLLDNTTRKVLSENFELDTNSFIAKFQQLSSDKEERKENEPTSKK